MLEKKVNWLRGEIIQFADPEKLASFTGMEYKELNGEVCYIFYYFNQAAKLSYPGLIACDLTSDQILTTGNQAVICYYCYSILKSGIHESRNEWVSFSELDNGRIYAKAFQGYTGDQLAKDAGLLIDKFEAIKGSLDAELMDLGDFSFKINVLPKVSIALILWKEDDEFPASCNLLFNDYVNEYLPTDACAIVGSMFAHRLRNIIYK